VPTPPHGTHGLAAPTTHSSGRWRRRLTGVALMSTLKVTVTLVPLELSLTLTLRGEIVTNSWGPAGTSGEQRGEW
jgi:hypothetical protein